VSRHKCTIRLLRAAEDDFTEIVAYIAADRPSAAETLAGKIDKNLQLLSHNPHVGRVPKKSNLRSYAIVTSLLKITSSSTRSRPTPSTSIEFCTVPETI
jgi:plasmid stabilization system protein ParE